MSGKTQRGLLALVMWLAVVVYGGNKIYDNWTMTLTHAPGDRFTINANYQLRIVDGVAKLASSDKFMLITDKVVLNGTKIAAPLGWTSSEYYTSGEVNNSDEWTVLKAPSTLYVEVVSGQVITQPSFDQKWDDLKLTIIIGFIVWVIGDFFIAGLSGWLDSPSTSS